MQIAGELAATGAISYRSVQARNVMKIFGRRFAIMPRGQVGVYRAITRASPTLSKRVRTCS